MTLSKQLLVLLISLPLFGNISQEQQGKKIYLKADCQSCHYQDTNFDSKNNKVKNLSDLDNWLVGCGLKFDTNWKSKDETLVLKYLNNIYYQLDK